MELASWRELSDGGPDLVPCLDFPGGRAAAGFADLAAGVPAGACFVHLAQPGTGPLGACVARWAAELAGTGRPVRAVLGFCAGTALATRLADAVAAAGPAPAVVLFDAVTTTAATLASQFATALEASARHLTAGELDDARALAEQLAATCPGDLPRIAAALAGRYDQLIRVVAARLSVHEFFRQELTRTFTAYMDYLLLASQGGFDMRTATPLFLSSAGYQPPVPDACAITVEAGHADLLRAPRVHELVTDLLTGEHPW
jgi:hypothetical protein